MAIDPTRFEKLNAELSIRHGRLRDLLQQAEAARSVVDDIAGQLLTAEQELAEADPNPRTVYRGPGEGPSAAERINRTAGLPTLMERLRGDRARAAARLAAVEAEQRTASASWRSLARLVARCEAFLLTTAHAHLPPRGQAPPVTASRDDKLAGRI
jgi:hypothetical protein